jgi:hypothetical protein
MNQRLSGLALLVFVCLPLGGESGSCIPETTTIDIIK